MLSFDDKGIAMRHEDLREATRKATEKTPHTLHSRLAKGEKSNRKRMAKVARWSLCARDHRMNELSVWTRTAGASSIRYPARTATTAER